MLSITCMEMNKLTDDAKKGSIAPVGIPRLEITLRSVLVIARKQ